MTTTNRPAGVASAEEILARARAVVDPVLRTAVDSLPAPLDLMAGYHFGWWDSVGVPVNGNGGKALRPALVLAAARACGGLRPEHLAGAAAAIELSHNFTLLHDDVMDADRTRRGRPTVWSVWGVTDAILAGDALHALAIRVLTTGLAGPMASEFVARLEDCLIEVCRGQLEDCAFENRGDIELAECLRMATGKTGALLGCACALGALGTGASAAVVAGMDRFGRELGLAFQLVDDLLGIWGDPANTGKPAGNDVARGKRSLPVVAALRSGTAAADELAGLCRKAPRLTAAEVARAATLVEVAGGRRWAQTEADARLRTALDSLPDPSMAGDLITLAYRVVNRDR